MRIKFLLLLPAAFILSFFSAKAQDNNCLSSTDIIATVLKPPVILNRICVTKTTLLPYALQPQQYTGYNPSKDYYLTKSRHQKTIAWIMLGGGTGLTALGFAIASTNAITNSSHGDAGANAVAIAGLASMAGSIPFFISAAHNKKKAASISFNMQNLPAICTVAHYSATLQPAIHLYINL